MNESMFPVVFDETSINLIRTYFPFLCANTRRIFFFKLVLRTYRIKQEDSVRDKYVV
jgi:hypothetical protein